MKVRAVADTVRLWLNADMTAEEIQAAAEALSPEDRNRLLGFTVFLNLTPEERAETRQELTRAITTGKPGRWQTVERARTKLQDLEQADEVARAETLP